MFGFFMNVVKEDKNEYLVHILVNQNVIPEIDALTDLYGQKKFEKDVEGYIRTGRKVAVLEIESAHHSLACESDCTGRKALVQPTTPASLYLHTRIRILRDWYSYLRNDVLVYRMHPFCQYTILMYFNKKQ